MSSITKESVEQRMATLRFREQELLNEANAVHGAAIDCEYWLGVLSEPPPELATIESVEEPEER